MDSSTGLHRAAADPETNPFLRPFRRWLLPDIERERPDIVGLSIPTLGQVLAAVTVAHLVKEAGLPCHVTAGGPHVTMLREALPNARPFFDLFDSAVYFDGEEPLLALAEALAGHHDLGQVPNLIHREGNRVRVSERKTAAGTLEPRLPDFDGLPLDRYLSPEPVLPLLSSRGCYHGKCAFCNVGYGQAGHYRPLPPETVVEQMLALHERYGTRHIFFADEAITPHHLRIMSDSLARQSSPLDWCGCVRFEKALTPDLLAQMARGGCTMLLYGLETAAEPMIRRMVKGTDQAEMGRVLDQGAAAGLWNHTFFFFGFPGETLEQAQETVNFVYAHQRAVHSASPGAFVLERYSPAYQSPEKYGIRRIMRDAASGASRDLAIYFEYQAESGLDERTAGLVADRFVESLPGKRFAHFYANDTWRFLYASRLKAEGKPFPLWLVPE